MFCQAKRQGQVKLCNCKRTGAPPFCDNSHVRLRNDRIVEVDA
jgi:CDGSH-type Zn-finger protein